MIFTPQEKTDRVWSTRRIPAGAHAYHDYDLFQTPQGQVGQGYAFPLDRTETNLKEGGRIYNLLDQDLVPFGQAKLWGFQVEGLPSSYLHLTTVRVKFLSGVLDLGVASDHLHPAATWGPVSFREYETFAVLLSFGNVPVLLHDIDVRVTLFFNDLSDPLLQLAEVKRGRVVGTG